MKSILERGAIAALLSLVLVACGGGGGGGNDAASGSSNPPPVVVEKPATRSDAARFLTQATFGPTDADIDRVMAVGYAAWIDEQLALPTASHRAHYELRDAEIKALNAANTAGPDQVFESFWKQAVTGPDQLRQRMNFALSQIFVISLADSAVANEPRNVAAWMDMLGDKGITNYRDLLESVSRHPVMGTYLSHLRNQKANTATGRVPDENYAREVLQLFSIGLIELNEDGSARLTGGNKTDTYAPTDVAGLARVFTGWSYACPASPQAGCFFSGTVNNVGDPDRGFKPMVGYPEYHSTEQKSFLSTTIPAQTTADPYASLKTALDALANHANVGPFIGKQLIQRLVTSNPSPTYVRDVARVWANNGAGVRGDTKAVLKAVLMHAEARTVSDTSGKVREPVLRLSAFMRAFGAKSDTGNFRVGNTDNPGTQLGQTPLRSPSVFNYYRPGYVAPGTASAGRNLVAPELQIAHETSAAGYVNFMRDNVASGVGLGNPAPLNRRDIQPDYTGELAIATDSAALVDRVLGKLSYGTPAAALKTEIVTAVNSIVIPAATSSNQATVDAARRTRVNAAVLLVLASPEFTVQN
ncbi:MAG: DUF1800 domain-containing protein [Rubrivivax sp.]|nr:DUF1800 domain-containing protein [Rubrivivax sp.]